ncbi:probable glutamate carboxypeptidase LAMP1 [Selaginella moellendorffii]|uniref:probable glutamate carboxypeptidase LAMP1 n=1 Tax=Selaginella moellendorffii TaxID=88036 RepID=UPI000D1C2467|nr:probable glutamate carboxypeptidase LAMP1 [Selaginella moellendorffii]|eukprot:XP_024544851.1 probable glutamate carboxypeptidase LAMP1 [Selaginella moellendorffii]
MASVSRCRCCLLSLVLLAFAFFSSTGVKDSGFTLDKLEDEFLSGLSNNTISKFLKELTLEPHVAGTAEDLATAKYVFDHFEASGIVAHYSDYSVLLSYPIRRSLSLHLPDGSLKDFTLKEEAVEGDPYSTNPKVIPTFFAYSPSGTISSEVVYVNYGREEDFLTLKDEGVNVTGTVVIARIGKIFRGDIAANAAAAGAAAAITYSDPFDYAGNGSQGYYPSSQWLPPSGVQRGSLFLTNGDPLTPGWPSVPDAERLEISQVQFPKIPVLPVSAQDALPILEALTGKVAPQEWQGGLQLSSYRLGRGPAKVKLSYEGNLTMAPIRNVIGMITGSEEPDRYILLGNHRDAWTFGAADPNSGTACLLEIARGFGNLLSLGWRPRRTIIFCSWDAEEFGLIGSSEWVERNLNLLASRAVAYLNVDSAVGGPNFDGRATPQLDNILLEVTKKVKDPNSVYGTVYEAWSALNGHGTPNIGRLGSGSDFSAFLHHAGIPSCDIRYQTLYPMYHSLYDDYNWMERFGDPMFHRHVAVSGIWGLLAIHLAGDAVLSFNYANYADELEAGAMALQKNLLQASENITANPLFPAISKLRAAAAQLGAEMIQMKVLTDAQTLSKLRSLNDRMLLAERSFLDPSGLTGTSWYKHVIYGPSGKNHYNSQLFPGVCDALAAAMSINNKASWNALQHEIWKVARAITNVAHFLSGELH